MQLRYQKILLKLSGELFMRGETSVDARAVDAVAAEIAELVKKGVRVGAVIGGGNIMRGRTIRGNRDDELAGHRAGMVATVVNGIMLARALGRREVKAQVFSAFAVGEFAAPDDTERVARAMRAGTVLLFTGGTGVPFKSTDSAVVRKAVSMGAQAIFKVTTHVDGVYDRDPRRFADAKKFHTLTYEEALKKKLGVMDLEAFKEAQQYHLPIHVLKCGKGRMMRVLKGERVGSVVN